MTRFIYSHSLIGAHDRCPASFSLLQSGAARTHEASPFLFGRAFHKFAQLYRDHCITEQRRSDIEIVPDLIDQVFRIIGLSTAHYEELTELCMNFVAWEPIDIERSLQREAGLALDSSLQRLQWRDEFEYDSDNFAHPFMACLCESAEDCFHATDGEATCARERAVSGICGLRESDSVHQLFLRMQMDEVLVDPAYQLLIIDDHKTDRHIPSQTEIEDPAGRWWKQANEYAWGGATYLYPAASEIEVRFKFVRWGVTRRLTIAKESADAYGQTLLRKIGFIEDQREFPARPGNHCRWCPFLGGACPVPAASGMYAEPIEDMAARYVYGEALRESQLAALKEVASEDGTVMVGGLPVLIFERKERRFLDVQKALEAMESEGIENPHLLLDISPSKLERLLDADQYERVINAATASSETEVVFNVHQNKPELIALAQRLGIEAPQKMKVGELAQAIAKATTRERAA